MSEPIGKRRVVMQIKFTLDGQVDANLINELQDRSNGGPISKVIYLAIYEWYFMKCAQSTDQGQSSTDQGQSDDLIDVVDLIENEW